MEGEEPGEREEGMGVRWRSGQGWDVDRTGRPVDLAGKMEQKGTGKGAGGGVYPRDGEKQSTRVNRAKKKREKGVIKQL